MSYAGEILKLFFILGILIGVLYLMLFLARKYLYSFDKNVPGNIKIDVISAKGIAPKKSVSVLKIKDKVYVLGVCENAITLIDKLEGSSFESDEELKLPENKNFLSLLKSNLSLK